MQTRFFLIRRFRNSFSQTSQSDRRLLRRAPLRSPTARSTRPVQLLNRRLGRSGGIRDHGRPRGVHIGEPATRRSRAEAPRRTGHEGVGKGGGI
uniref:Uncharacterized protein n=1 Tax=Arundo donax TaxID=35708 RepID=A0A0A9DG80_ARUDO